MARLLGISERAVRKRIVAGTLLAERTAQGWQVALEAVPEAVPAEPGAVPPEPSPEPAEPRGGTAVPGGGTSTALSELQRAEALAQYAAAILSPVIAELGAARQQIADQAETIGALRAQLAAAEANLVNNIREVPSPPWWRRWRRWRVP